jgi:hypothetical protein
MGRKSSFMLLFLIFICASFVVFSGVYADDVPSWLRVGDYVEYVGGVGNDLSITSRFEVVEIDYLNKIVVEKYQQPNIDLYTDNYEIDLANPEKGMSSNFFMTHEAIEKIKVQPVKYESIGWTFSYTGKDSLNTSIGSFTCHKLSWTQEANFTYGGTAWVEEGTGVVLANFYRVAENNVTMMVSSTNIFAPRLASISVFVKDSSNNPLPGANITSTVQPAGQAILKGVAGKDGSVYFNNVTPGSYTFSATLSSYISKIESVSVTLGPMTTKAIVLVAQQQGIPGYPIESLVVGVLICTIILINIRVKYRA